jgi:TrmH family RNA methyltransferase
MARLISSPQNPLVKRLLQLQEKSRERRRSGRFLVEGAREVRLAGEAGYQLEHLLYCTDLVSQEVLEGLPANAEQSIELTEAVYRRLAYRDSTEGILAEFSGSSPGLEQLRLGTQSPLILVAEAPEKPGNIGALLRTADAAAVDAVIIANPRTDLFNPNIIRSSVGGVFTNQVASGTTSEVIEFLKANHIHIYAAALQASVSYLEVDFRGPTAIVVGTEATGLGPEWLEHSTAKIRIPMGGRIDSMNVSVAAGILIFEARRQRG